MTLHEWMKAQGLNDADLAKRVKISRSQICRIRRGDSMPSLPVAKRIQDEVGQPVMWGATQ